MLIETNLCNKKDDYFQLVICSKRFQAYQNYQLPQTQRMNDFQRIFQNKLANSKLDSKVPVSCAIKDIYQAQRNLLVSSKSRKDTIEEKNKRIAQENLHYRNQLSKKLFELQQKHDKNRRDALNKVVKSEERKREYRGEIFSRHKNSEKEHMKARLGLFKEHSQHMHQFWNGNKLQTQRSFKSQSAVKPLYWETVDLKKNLQNQQHQKGLNVKNVLLKRHEGREDLVHAIYERKQEEIHQIHKQKIQKTLSKNVQLLDDKTKRLINNIGDDFRKSQQLLRLKQKQLNKKINDKQIDEQDHRLTIRSNFQDRYKLKSASLANCECKRINNIQQSNLKSHIMKEKLRHTYFSDSIRKLERQPSQFTTKNSQFLSKSQSFRSTVSYNKSLLDQRKHKIDTERLQRQKAITDSIALKQSLQVQGNCSIRKTAVK